LTSEGLNGVGRTCDPGKMRGSLHFAALRSR
jgi:hypothetical protein